MARKVAAISKEIEVSKKSLDAAMRFFVAQVSSFSGPPRTDERTALRREATKAAGRCQRSLRSVLQLEIRQIDESADISAALAAVREANKKLNDVINKDMALKNKLDRVSSIVSSITQLVRLGKQAGLFGRSA